MISLDSLPQPARQAFEGLQSELLRLQRVIQLKDEQIRLLNFRLFGPKSEKLSSAQMSLMLEEISLRAGEVDQEAEQPEAQKQLPPRRTRKPRGHHPGREKLPEHLERREEIIPCCPEDCRCSKCGAERPIIGYDTREELAFEPAKFWVRVVKREKRGSHCLEEQGVATAAVPAQIVPKSKLSNDFVIELVVRKYQQHLPVYRQCATLAQEYGIDLSRKTLSQGILAVGGWLSAVVQAQAAQLVAGPYLQADETPVPCQTREKSGKNHRAFMWEYGVPGGPLVFDFRMGRGRDGPREFLKNFRGKLQCDGYAAYDKLTEGIVYVGCMAHARRTFVDAAKVAPNDPVSAEVIGRFGQLYQVEQEAREAGLAAPERQALRQLKSGPIMSALKERLVEIRQQTTPGTKLADACDYTLGQWSRLEEYLKDGLLEIDNNWCEGGMRPIALGRRNWLHIGSEEAGPKVAAIVSIVETCRRLQIKLREYLTDVLPRLGDWPVNRVAELTPAAWKAARNS
jgi:transposase